jgi:predicted ester cyclase
MTIDDLVAEGDEVVARLTATARQVGPFMGLPPSDRTYTIGEIHIFRIAGGQIVEHWHQADMLGLMRQLGALPAPGQPPGRQPPGGHAASLKG